MDSLSPDHAEFGKQKIVEHHCDKHGTTQVKIVRLSKEWSMPRCELCVAEGKAERERQEEEQRQWDARRARERDIAAKLNRAALPPRFADRSFADYEASNAGSRKALDTCQSYAEGFAENLMAGTSLILCGNAGTGKTHLACSIAHQVITMHAKAAVYMTVGKAFRMVKETYRRDSERTEEQAIAFFAVPDLLILDEIGVQYGSDSEKNILFEIVNERYEAMKPTILISNLALPALTEYAGERVIDRLKENSGKLVVFDWKSHRGAAA